MDFIDIVKQFSKRVETIKDNIKTEEATKTSILMPFFSMLEYDIFNPNEFTPEFTADVGIKKGEKVDFAIMKNNEPIILIEAKSIDKNLERHDSQLFRYFGTTKAKFAILTNGIIYRFYTDADEVNKMDKDPFLEINILKLKDSQIMQLKKFTKSAFNLNQIMDTASLFKYERKFKSILVKQLQEPSDDFIKFFLQSVYNGQKNQSVIEKFRPILKKSLNDFINETVNEKITSALIPAENTKIIEEPKIEKLVKTTPSDDEMEAFYLIKTILKNILDMQDIYYKITDSYFAVLYKNNTRKWICRFIFTDYQKTFVLPDENKNGFNKYKLQNINDIMDYKNQIIHIINKYYIDTPLSHSIPLPTQEYKIRVLPRPKKKKRTLPNKHLRTID